MVKNIFKYLPNLLEFRVSEGTLHGFRTCAPSFWAEVKMFPQMQHWNKSSKCRCRKWSSKELLGISPHKWHTSRFSVGFNLPSVKGKTSCLNEFVYTLYNHCCWGISNKFKLGRTSFFTSIICIENENLQSLNKTLSGKFKFWC